MNTTKPQTANEFVRALPVALFWPAPRAIAVCVTITIEKVAG